MKSTTQAADGLIDEMDQPDPNLTGGGIPDAKPIVHPDGEILSPTMNKPATSRRRSMFFEKVGQKDPPFGKTLFLYKVVGGKDYFTTGKLKAKVESDDGFAYRFSDDQDSVTDAHEFEYYLLPVVS